MERITRGKNPVAAHLFSESRTERISPGAHHCRSSSVVSTFPAWDQEQLNGKFPPGYYGEPPNFLQYAGLIWSHMDLYGITWIYMFIWIYDGYSVMNIPVSCHYI